ncbi:cupin domain-containing protein [Devosia algicola]|uniref:Cupin domain-containing protein n=1 Tax=Devosia algicola TaxID=3026418 RepID=A0ABY7YRG7_9HYPH|nr:cupin domain-containing protein [Devosia algicola]WDR03881.1 cupin domain-containing protein [Devosia algicola]
MTSPGADWCFMSLWETTGPLAQLGGTEDAGAGPVKHHPPVGGSRFRIVEFMPDQVQRPDLSAADFEIIQATQHVIEDAADPGMHRNDTVDYNIILSGEIHAVLETGAVLLKAGDVLIQRGTTHTWHNRSDKPCVFASIMVSAEPLPAPNKG